MMAAVPVRPSTGIAGSLATKPDLTAYPYNAPPMAICTDSLEISPLAMPPLLLPPLRRYPLRRRRTGAARGLDTRIIGAGARTIFVTLRVRGALYERRFRLAICLSL